MSSLRSLYGRSRSPAPRRRCQPALAGRRPAGCHHLHPAPELAKRPRRPRGRLPHLGINRSQVPRSSVRDPQPLDTAADRPDVVHSVPGQRIRVAFVGSGRDCIISAASATVRVMGPMWRGSRRRWPDRSGSGHTDGWPKMPANEAGIRIEPPRPCRPRAGEARRPPRLHRSSRPASGRGSTGYGRRRKAGCGSPRASRAWGVLVLPTMMAPAAFRRATIGASSVGTLSAKSGVPNVVRTPLVMTRSFTENGTP